MGQEMQVYALYLLNRAKRQRIGTQLLRSVMCQFLTSGASSCVWTLRDAIPARRFYEYHHARFACEEVERNEDYQRTLVGYVWPDLRQQFPSDWDVDDEHRYQSD